MNTEQLPENWLPVVGYEGFYEVSDQGRVRSLPRTTTKGGLLRLIPFQYGHLRVNLSRAGKARLQFVHRLVLEAFVGPCPDNYEGCHFPDRDPANNRLQNLFWGTKTENMSHKAIHGTHPDKKGEAHPLAKLRDTDLPKIREMLAAGMSQTSVSKLLGVTQSAVSRMLSGKRWGHLVDSSREL